jgi:hypothetical protein
MWPCWCCSGFKLSGYLVVQRASCVDSPCSETFAVNVLLPCSSYGHPFVAQLVLQDILAALDGAAESSTPWNVLGSVLCGCALPWQWQYLVGLYRLCQEGLLDIAVGLAEVQQTLQRAYPCEAPQAVHGLVAAFQESNVVRLSCSICMM